MKLFAQMNSKFDHMMDFQASKLVSPSSSHHSSDVSLSSSTRSDTPHSDDLSLNDDSRDDHIHNGQLKSQSSTPPLIKECKPSNKLSFGISRLLSSKTTDSKCIDNYQGHKIHPNHQQDSLDVNESNKLNVDSLLNKSEKSNDSDLRVPVQQYHSSPLGYHNPFSWLSPQMTSAFIPKDRLSGKAILMSKYLYLSIYLHAQLFNHYILISFILYFMTLGHDNTYFIICKLTCLYF